MAEKTNFLQTLLNTAKLTTVEPYLFFCLFGYTARLVSYQNLLMDRACRNMYHYSDEICSNLDNHLVEQAECIEAGNNLFLGVMIMSSLPAVIVATFLGPWSDKYSRKYPMIFSAGGMFLEGFFGAVLTVFPGLSPIWYVVTGLFSGVTGGFIISVSAAYSYLSDVTDERSRPARFAILEFFNIAAIVVGNLVGGQVFELSGYLAVFIVTPCCFGCALLYAIFCLKETKPKISDDKRYEMFRDLFRLDNVKQSYITCSRQRAGNLRRQIWCLVWIGCCQRFADMGTIAVAFPFVKKVYKWGVTAFSNASIAFYVVNAIVTVTVLPFLSNKLRLHEAAVGLIGMLSLISKMVITSLADREFMFYFAWMSGTLANGVGVAVRSRLSKLVGKEELGRVFSLLGMCESFTPVLGSLAFLQIYNATVRTFPGFAFAAAALFLIPCAVMFAWMMRMPTISLTEYARFELDKQARPLEEITSSNYAKLEEEQGIY